MLNILLGFILLFSVTYGWTSSGFETSNMYSLEQTQVDSENSQQSDRPGSDGEEDEKEFDDDFLKLSTHGLDAESFNKLESRKSPPHKPPFLDGLDRPPRA